MKTLTTVEELRSIHRSPELLAKALKNLRADLIGQAEALNDRVQAEKRDYLASEDREYKAIQKELRAADVELNKIDLAADDHAAMYRTHGHDPRPTYSGRRMSELEENIESFARGDGRRSLEVSLAGLQPRFNPTTGRVEVRDLSVGTATAGGDTVPQDFVGRLYEHMIEVSAIRRAGATVLVTNNGQDLPVPKTTAHSSSASIVTEGAQISESDPTFDQVTLQAFKYAQIIQVTNELLTDTGVDLTGYLARQGGRALGNGAGAHFVTGTGSSQPNGIVTAATVGVTGATGNSGEPTADELIDLWSAVIPEYRQRGTWMMNSSTWGKVRKLKDSNNNYLIGPIGASGELTLLGRPVVLDPNVADTATSAKSVVFGDISAYYIRDVAGVRIERSDDFAFDFDLATFRFILRTDGDLIDTSGAVKVYQGGAS